MELSDAARELALRCAPRVNELARQMARVSFERIPGYAEFPGDMKDLEIAATARHGMRLFLRRVRDPQDRHDDTGLFRERAAQRAEEGVPLHLLLRTHALGVRVLWQALCDECAPGEEAALQELTGMLLRAQESTAGAVAESYLEERTVLEAERREHRRSMVRALLDGTLDSAAPPPDGLGLEPDHPCLVLALRIPRAGEQPEGDAAQEVRAARNPRAPLNGRPGDGSPGLAVAERRVLRRVQKVLDQHFGAPGDPTGVGPGVAALLEEDRQGGTAVVPGTNQAPPELVNGLRRAAGCRVRVAAVAAAGPAQVPEAAHTAGEVLRVARRAGLPPGLHRLDDVLLEFHLSRPSASSPGIAALLDPLDDSPELLRTLRVHLEQRQQRRSTAHLLRVHPNTVDNRLARITECTGLDPAVPRDAALAIAALLLRERPVRGPEFGTPSAER